MEEIEVREVLELKMQGWGESREVMMRSRWRGYVSVTGVVGGGGGGGGVADRRREVVGQGFLWGG